MKAATAIHAYARSKQWRPDEYHIFMKVRSDLYTLQIKLVSDHLDDLTEDQEIAVYDDVTDDLDRALKQSKAFNYCGLVLSGSKRFASSPARHLRDDEFEIDEELINDGVSWSKPFRPAIH